jgi:hypothetical protein
MKVLSISVHSNKFHSFNFGADHVVHCVLAGTTNTDDLDTSESFYLWFDLWHKNIMRVSAYLLVNTAQY